MASALENVQKVPVLGTAVQIVDDLFSSKERIFKNRLEGYLKEVFKRAGMPEGAIEQFLDKFRDHLDTGRDQDIHGKIQEFLAGLASNPQLSALVPQIAQDIASLPGADKALNLSTLMSFPPVMSNFPESLNRKVLVDPF